MAGCVHQVHPRLEPIVRESLTFHSYSDRDLFRRVLDSEMEALVSEDNHRPQDARNRVPESHQQQNGNSDSPLSKSKPHNDNSTTSEEAKDFHIEQAQEDHGIRRIIRNFTPSYSLLRFPLFWR